MAIGVLKEIDAAIFGLLNSRDPAGDILNAVISFIESNLLLIGVFAVAILIAMWWFFRDGGGGSDWRDMEI